MGLLTAAESPPREPRALRRWRRTAGSWVWITLVFVLASLSVEQLCAFPSSLSDCQTPTGWNCSGFDDPDTDLFLCDTNTCQFDGECLRIGEIVMCICNFKCNNDYVPVCGSNNQNYQNKCFLRRDACKKQSEVLVTSDGACPAEDGEKHAPGPRSAGPTPAVSTRAPKQKPTPFLPTSPKMKRQINE